MVIPQIGPDETLPPGRYRATRDELHTRFVDGHDPMRALLWRDWTSATNLLGRYVHLNAAWLYGPFLSTAAQPRTVNCLYWAEDVELDKAFLDATAARFLRVFAVPGHIRRLTGLKVDTHVAAWHCQPDLKARDDRYDRYTQHRGTMDDLLQRAVTAGVATRADAWPQRGYVEVIIDDYT